MSRCVDLDERVTAQFYDQECEEWTMQTVTIEDVLDSVCNEYTVLPSAQPTDADIQKMQDIEQAMLGKAYECGKQDAVQWIPCSERLPEINQIVLLSTNSKNVYVGYRNKPELLWQVEEDGRKQWVYDPESYDVDIDVLPKTEDIDFYCEGVNDGGFLSITSANYNDRFEGVTAWMPLPEPYKEDEQG